jgi:hypothetical protein
MHYRPVAGLGEAPGVRKTHWTEGIAMGFRFGTVDSWKHGFKYGWRA